MTERLIALVDDLVALPAETAWVEFKENNGEPNNIGKLISALSNAARLADKDYAYVLWGVRDLDRAILGTDFEPSATIIQQQPLEFWLLQRLAPPLTFIFNTIDHPQGRLVLLAIPAANVAPVEFDRAAYIRIGSATPRLTDYPHHQRTIWSKLQSYIWERAIASQFVTGDDVLRLLDYASYFELTRQPLPDNREGIFDKLTGDQLILEDVGGRWNITNLGAILFAKNLSDFDPRLGRKAIRFVAYDGNGRADNVTHRRDGQRGYAAGFKGLIEYVAAILPQNEHIGEAFRTETTIFPPIAIRELTANALIHQDMTVTGAGPLIELFKDRIEITNPGIPLIQPDRFIDSAPRSRNESLAALMRRMNICEEQGTGVDKVIAAAEVYQLPAPDFRVEDHATRIVLYAPRRFAAMTPEERVRACYQHAVLKYLAGDSMRNSTLRERFGIEARNAAQVSAVIKIALERKLIRPSDPNRPQASYIPSWA